MELNSIGRAKRGGGVHPVSLKHEPVGFDCDQAEVLAVHEALDRLSSLDPRKAQVVSLRYFAGLTIDESAEVMEVSTRLVDSEWKLARAWLHRELSKGGDGESGAPRP